MTAIMTMAGGGQAPSIAQSRVSAVRQRQAIGENEARVVISMERSPSRRIPSGLPEPQTDPEWTAAFPLFEGYCTLRVRL